VQGPRRSGDIEFVTRRFAQEAELLQVHGAAALSSFVGDPCRGGKYRNIIGLLVV
jgi:hypothetical protein